LTGHKLTKLTKLAKLTKLTKLVEALDPRSRVDSWFGKKADAA